MIRFLVFLLIILASCMVLLGATHSNHKNQPAVYNTDVMISDDKPIQPTNNAHNLPVRISLSLSWTEMNMVFISKLLVLAVIVLMAVMNYISFLQKKEEY